MFNIFTVASESTQTQYPSPAITVPPGGREAQVLYFSHRIRLSNKNWKHPFKFLKLPPDTAHPPSGEGSNLLLPYRANIGLEFFSFRFDRFCWNKNGERVVWFTRYIFVIILIFRVFLLKRKGDDWYSSTNSNSTDKITYRNCRSFFF